VKVGRYCRLAFSLDSAILSVLPLEELGQQQRREREPEEQNDEQAVEPQLGGTRAL
jgi:hypothetical protein